MRGCLILVMLLNTMPVSAETRQLRWDYPAQPRLSFFLLQACLPHHQDCRWRDVQRLGAWRRQTPVHVPDQGTTKCFQLWAIVGQQRSGPSNVLCVP